jgi:hypothetical protein
LHGEYFKKFLDHYEKRANDNVKTTKKTSSENLLLGVNLPNKENYINNIPNLEYEDAKQPKNKNEEEFLR